MGLPTIKFVFDRRHRAGSDRKGTVDLRITYDYKQKFVSTSVSCYAGQWDERNECVSKNCTDADALNAILVKIRKKVLGVIGNMVEEGRVDIAAIPQLLKNHSEDMTFESYIYKRMRDKPVSDYTRKSYTSFYARFTQWGGMRFFRDVTEKGIRDFDEWLHTVKWKETDRFGNEVEKKYSQASIGSMHKNLKAFINDAIIDGHLRENPYSTKRIKIDKGETRISSFLTAEEVKKIENAVMPTRSLSEARDLFLVQIYTGLAYVDLMAYDFTQCMNAKNYAVFSGIRSKTGTVFTFVLTPKAKKVLKAYSFIMPKIPNQKYNVKLKIVADAAGIDKNITTHDGRRTCGYMLLNAGVPISVVSRVLGHSSIRQTEVAYARVLDETIAKEIRKHVK